MSVEQRTRETRRKAVSRLQSAAWSFSCLARFSRQSSKKETARSLRTHVRTWKKCRNIITNRSKIGKQSRGIKRKNIWTFFQLIFNPKCGVFFPILLPAITACKTRSSVGNLSILLRNANWISSNHTRDRGGSRIFFRRGCTRRLLYFNTCNKPHCFLFFCRIPVVLENRRSSQGGGVRTPCTLPLDPPLRENKWIWRRGRIPAGFGKLCIPLENPSHAPDFGSRVFLI